MFAKSILFFTLILCVHSLKSFPIKTEFLDCFSDDDLKSTQTKPPSTIDCKSINPQLAKCTCTKDYIDCSNLNFFSIPSDLSKMPDTIKRLFFSRNQIDSLGSLQLNPAAKITAIDIRRNKIKKIDNDFFSPQLTANLDYLSMCGNLNLNDFNSIRANFTKLTWLELSHVVEEFKVADGFFSREKFPQLMKLNLNDANLKLGKKPFDRLDKLELLRLDSNHLSQLPCESFLEFLSLTSLNLNNNFLSKKPDVSQDCLKNSNELRELHLQGNELTENDLTWMSLGQFKKLEKLDLSANRFEKMPYEALKNLKSMRSLKMSIEERQLSRPDASSGELWPLLSHLDLSGSKIVKIGSCAFEKISVGLNELILKGCGIKELDADAFGKLNNLILLDLSNNNLRTLHKPTSLAMFNYDLLRGNVNLTGNKFECTKELDWLLNFYDYELFDETITCHAVNGTLVSVHEFITSHRKAPAVPRKTSGYNILIIILLVLIMLVIIMGVAYVVRRKQMKIRQQQYRYRYFTERSQDDGFDTDNVPVYRDCTVSLRIQDTDDSNIVNSNGDTAQLTEQPDVVA